MSSAETHHPFDNVINFRDVGKTINGALGKTLLQEGVCFRSARLDEASEEDMRRLTVDLHITTIIDLRSTTEHQMAVTKYKRNHKLPTTASPDSEPEADEGYVHLPSLKNTETHRHLISLTGRAFEKHLLWRLDWWNFTKVLAYLAAGYKHAAVRIIGEHIMKPAGLVGLAMDTLEASTAEIKEIFELLGSESDAATESQVKSGVLIHCTQGKDRTGLVILLSLLLTGVVDADAISGEYVLSEKELEKEPAEEKETRMKEIRALGLDEEYTKCPPDFTQRITAFLNEKYGGVKKYLEFVGVEDRVLENVRRRFVA
ncbi:protein-tyrosine phosphatase-like protein [Aspergillus karnatakaensis]|uniref:putative tyrosine/serine protein phosphatase n=1 Tax=Aspergillus karnatakaensis TaxID=1810916 RepID=UPI003CCC99EF